MHKASNKVKHSLLWIGICLAISGCYKQSEGCIDKLASNYTPTSEQGCKDCCTWPQAKWEFTHVWKDTLVQFNKKLTANDVDTFVLIDQNFYLTLVSYQEPSPFDILDSISLPSINEGRSLKRNAVLVKKNQTSTNIHRFKGNESISELNLQIGLDEIYNQVSTEDAEKVDLLKSSQGMRVNNDYLAYKLTMARGENLADTITLNLEMPTMIVLSRQVNLISGNDVVLKLTFDYDILLENINFELDSPTVIQEKLERQIGKSFY